MDLSSGTTINKRYKIIEKHNFGGMGQTFIAEDKKLKQKVILKALVFRDMENWKSFELFEREIKTLQNLDHPRIPRYYDHFEIHEKNNAYYFLVQEYVEGFNLFELVESGKKFSNEEVEYIFKSLLSILKYLHNLNPSLIHRDIQPKNIIMGVDGKVYLVDFGSVGEIPRNTLAAGNTFVGTIGYFPPEQLMAKAYPSSDLYALAMCVIFLITGKNPSDLPMAKGRVDFKPYSHSPLKLNSLLYKMISPAQEQRFQTVEAVLSALDTNDNVLLKPKRHRPKRNKLSKKNGFILFLILLAAILSTAGYLANEWLSDIDRNHNRVSLNEWNEYIEKYGFVSIPTLTKMQKEDRKQSVIEGIIASTIILILLAFAVVRTLSTEQIDLSSLNDEAANNAMTKQSEYNWAGISHISGLFFSVIGPILLWFIFRNKSKFVSIQAIEAMNFHINLIILVYFIPYIYHLLQELDSAKIIILPIAFFILILRSIFMASHYCMNGKFYRYPVNIRYF